jgi:hypothetical protein
MGNIISNQDIAHKNEENYLYLKNPQSHFSKFMQAKLLDVKVGTNDTTTNLKRACCSKNSANTGIITVPMANDDLNTYSTIRLAYDDLNTQKCTIETSGQSKIYAPSTLQVPNQACENFYSRHCNKIYDDRKNNSELTGSQVNYMQEHELNWFADCNCQNSVLKEGKTAGTSYYAPLDEPSVFDSKCKLRVLPSPMTPYWTTRDHISASKGLTVCQAKIEINNSDIGKLNASGIELSNECGNTVAQEPPTPPPTTTNPAIDTEALAAAEEAAIAAEAAAQAQEDAAIAAAAAAQDAAAQEAAAQEAAAMAAANNTSAGTDHAGTNAGTDNAGANAGTNAGTDNTGTNAGTDNTGTNAGTNDNTGTNAGTNDDDDDDEVEEEEEEDESVMDKYGLIIKIISALGIACIIGIILYLVLKKSKSK